MINRIGEINRQMHMGGEHSYDQTKGMMGLMIKLFHDFTDKYYEEIDDIFSEALFHVGVEFNEIKKALEEHDAIRHEGLIRQAGELAEACYQMGGYYWQEELGENVEWEIKMIQDFAEDLIDFNREMTVVEVENTLVSAMVDILEALKTIDGIIVEEEVIVYNISDEYLFSRLVLRILYDEVVNIFKCLKELPNDVGFIFDYETVHDVRRIDFDLLNDEVIYKEAWEEESIEALKCMEYTGVTIIDRLCYIRSEILEYDIFCFSGVKVLNKLLLELYEDDNVMFEVISDVDESVLELENFLTNKTVGLMTIDEKSGALFFLRVQRLLDNLDRINDSKLKAEVLKAYTSDLGQQWIKTYKHCFDRVIKEISDNYLLQQYESGMEMLQGLKMLEKVGRILIGEQKNQVESLKRYTSLFNAGFDWYLPEALDVYDF